MFGRFAPATGLPLPQDSDWPTPSQTEAAAILETALMNSRRLMILYDKRPKLCESTASAA
ncbi:MAG: hypothetical protein Kow0099_27340 [Candidatus Abyssubacteria bacterium]